MYIRSRLISAAAAAAVVIFSCLCQAQDEPMTQGVYTDTESGITFTTWSSTPDADGWGAYTFGMALPEDAATSDATEYIGLLRCQSLGADRTGWCGIAHGGGMLQGLLLMAWPHDGEVLTSFRWATDYVMPGVYGGNATLTQISSSVNETGYEVLFRCQDCLRWSEGDAAQAGQSTAGSLMLGHAQGSEGPENGGCPEEINFLFHNNGYGLWQADLAGVASASYGEWAALATKTPTASCVSRK